MTYSNNIRAARQQLPVYEVRKELLQLLKASPVTVLVGETGSGKTTQIPQFCLEAGLAGNSCVACTQPRRVAATTVARRVAQERGCQVGQQASFNITANPTHILYLTPLLDHMLMHNAC